FEITVPEVNCIVDIVKQVLGNQGGVRMTGGGFGGCIVALMPPQLVDEVCQAVEQQYQTVTGLKESIYVCKAMPGAGAIN
ncbi:galactokinase, partial [Agarivorans sp. 1_MG-2023]|nr:galactokinase [Agarivorans sp. 1_MG-2023]